MAGIITVTKADGTKEPFEMQKLRTSLKRAGASEKEMAEISRKIESELIDGATTEMIYRKAFELLRSSEHVTAARYSLRRAMIGLGPTGFPFEDYLAELFRHQGYKAKTRSIIKGACVAHEVDIVASKGNENLIAEAKFHSQPGTKSDLQVVLYSYARFLDIKSVQKQKKNSQAITHAYVITNTKFTSTAIKYAECVGLTLLSWDYPRKNNLQDMIEQSRLYPVTVLQTLSDKEKRALLSQGTVLCRQLIDNPEILRSIGVPNKKISAVLEEERRLCTIQ